MLIRSLWARPIVDGSAGKHGELFWSTGVLEKIKPEFQVENILILTPLLPQTNPSGKTSFGAAQTRVLSPGFLGSYLSSLLEG